MMFGFPGVGQEWEMPLRTVLRRGALGEYNAFRGVIQQQRGQVLSEGPSMITWNLDREKGFSVKSFNNHLRAVKFPGMGFFPFDTIWRKEVPTKIQCFLWCCFHGRILTLDNLRIRGFTLPNWCALCQKQEESIDHLFIHCSFVSGIWGKVSSRLSISGPLPGGVQDLIKGWKWLNCGTPFESMHKVLLHSLCWFVWLERNEVIFRDVRPSSARVVYRLLSSCLSWLRVFAVISQHDFEIWMRQLTST
ncbi:Putative ribonuclease H protein At1g65750 [Linum perenne]